MDERFVIEIISYEAQERDHIIKKFITNLRISPNKAIKMLDDLPRVVTKPIPLEKAQGIKAQFDDVGVKTNLKTYEGKADESVSYSSNPTLTPLVTSQGRSDQPSEESGMASSQQIVSSKSLTTNESSTIPLEQEEAPTLAVEENSSSTLTQEADSLAEHTEDKDLQPTLENKPLEEIDTFGSQKRYTYSVRGTFLRAAIFPALLVALGLWLVLLSTVRFTLNAQLLSIAQQHTIFITNHLENELDALNTLDSSQNLSILQKNIQLARQSLSGSNISFTAASDNKGRILASWFDKPESFTPIGQEIIHATGEITKFIVESQELKHSLRHPLNNNLDVLAHPIVLQGQVSGAVFLGLNKRGIIPQLQHLFFSMLFATFLMFVLALLLTNFLGRNLIDDIRNLTKAADKLSCGDLDVITEVKSNTELRSLAKSLERIKDSFKLSLERWRTRRN